MSLLQKILAVRGEFVSHRGIITGECVLCFEKLSLSWSEWSRHLLEHTHEQLYYCTECHIGIENQTDHAQCPAESKINVFGRYDIGGRLDGFICKRCNYLQINDYRLLEHLQEEHSDAMYETDVSRVVLLPDVRPRWNIIPTGFAYIPPADRYRCGVGNCQFHGKNSTAYIEHFQKTHSTIKTYFCRYCKKILNRIARPTVPLAEVLQHIDLHSSHVHQCYYCDKCTTSKDEIQTHLMADHSDLTVKFWHNRRKAENGIELCELVEIVLDCSICDERVDGKTAAIDHFRTKHAGRQFNFHARKFIKDTTEHLYVRCSVDDSVCYREVFACGDCGEHFPDKAKWLGHFNAVHPNGLLTARHHLKWLKFTEHTTQHQRLMLFSCASCNNLKTPYTATIEGCYEHWKHQHIGSDYKPFRFQMTGLVKCLYCNTIATFPDLKTHITKEHGGNPFVALKAFEYRKICAICEYTTDADAAVTEDDDLIKHFKGSHSLAVQSNVANPIPFRDSDLRQILRISIHKKVKCAYCDEVFRTKRDYRIHHTSEHTKLEPMFSHIDDLGTMQLNGDCCHTPIEQQEFFNHLAHHKHSLACNKCLFKTTDAFAFACHQVECHERGTVSQKYRNFLERWYWRSKLIFGNGLVINQFNAIRTEFDTSMEFQRFVDGLIETKMRTYVGNGSNAMANVDDADTDADTTTAAMADSVIDLDEWSD